MASPCGAARRAAQLVPGPRAFESHSTGPTRGPSRIHVVNREAAPEQHSGGLPTDSNSNKLAWPHALCDSRRRAKAMT